MRGKVESVRGPTRALNHCVCGEKAVCPPAGRTDNITSHVRGKDDEGRLKLRHVKSLPPAYAGKEAFQNFACPHGITPRMREKRFNRDQTILTTGSPPRMRGKVIGLCDLVTVSGSPPRMWGKSLLRAPVRFASGSPRVCGEKRYSRCPSEHRYPWLCGIPASHNTTLASPQLLHSQPGDISSGNGAGYILRTTSRCLRVLLTSSALPQQQLRVGGQDGHGRNTVHRAPPTQTAPRPCVTHKVRHDGSPVYPAPAAAPRCLPPGSERSLFRLKW